MSKRSIGAVALALCLITIFGCGEAEDSEGEVNGAVDLMPQGAELDSALEAHLPPGTSFQEAQLGHRLFTPCTVCHGPDAGGTQLGPSLLDDEWIHVEPDLEQIAGIIRTGVAQPDTYPVPMPPNGGGAFDEAELRALAVYVMLVANSEGAR